ncbi:MAG: hypothetical protein JWO03_1856 [Bacteroidetes bacterium]|nr:hypothetical protein [Bacteroidota bacterium]
MHKARWPAVLLIACLLSSLHLSAGIERYVPLHIRDTAFNKQGGNFSLGVRNTINVFSDEPKAFGMGMGASFRLQLLDRVNTEWFADYMTSNLYNKANRTDVHVGWNVMFYLIKPKGFTRKLTPFVGAGHCFDYTAIKMNGENQQLYKRWTAAVQMSVGCHYNITPKLDISVTTLYVLHLGKELDADQADDGSVSIEEHRNAGWEGHLMLVISAHYKFLKLWKARK